MHASMVRPSRRGLFALSPWELILQPDARVLRTTCQGIMRFHRFWCTMYNSYSRAMFNVARVGGNFTMINYQVGFYQNTKTLPANV